MSYLRLQNSNGDDLVTINLEDGVVDVKEPSSLNYAARALWDAVHTVRHLYKGYDDLVITGAETGNLQKEGDVILTPGKGSNHPGEGCGGDVLIETPELMTEDDPSYTETRT